MSLHDPNISRPLLLLALACGVVLILDAVFLDQIPWTATVDDGTYAAGGVMLLRTGRAGIPMSKGLFAQDHDLVMYGRIPAAVVGLSQLAFGIHAAAARLPGLLAVCAGAGLTFLAARTCEIPAPLALAGGFLWFLSIPARMLAHSSRPDPFFMVFVVGASLLLLRALRGNFMRQFFWAGLAGGLSLEAHMIGSALLVTLTVTTFLLSPPGQRLRNAIWVCFGALLPLLLWWYIHVLSQPDVWSIQWGGLWQPSGPSALVAGPGRILDSTLLRYRAYFWDSRYHRYLVEACFLAAGIALALVRKSPARPLAILVVVFHAALALLSTLKHAGYMAAIYPFACVAIAVTFFGSPKRSFRVAGAALVAFYLAQTAYWVIRSTPPLPAQARADVLRHVGDKTFLAVDSWWFLFPNDLRMRSITAVKYVDKYAPQLPWAGAFEKYLRQEQVEFIAADKVLEDFLEPAQAAFLAERSTLIQEYDYGRGRWVKIYRLQL